MLKLNRVLRNTTYLLLILSLNLIVLAYGFEIPDVTFILQTNKNKIQPLCLAEGNAIDLAIDWIYPLVDTKENLPEIVSNYIPNINNDYNCDFSLTKHCSNSWQLPDWNYSKYDSHSFKVGLLDARWENFPSFITSNKTKEFSTHLVDIPNVFNLGISLRAPRNAEIFICEGWDPHKYPCYYINIGGSDNKQTFLRKYKFIPEKFSKNDTKLGKYKSEVGELSDDEWKTYSIGLDENGTITLVNVYKNVTILKYTDKTPLKPISVVFRSKNVSALWKIHKNQYMFTNKAKLIQLGPTFGIFGSKLCVSLYVTMCRFCKMSFFLMNNGTRILLKDVSDNEEKYWQKIKLIRHDVFDNKIQLFIETSFINDTESDGFWAIDDVRVCSENEIRITRLSTTVNETNLENIRFSCQVLNFPMWRPPQHNYIYSGGEIKYNSSTQTSIKLFWNNNVDVFQKYYMIQYSGADLCNHDGMINLLPINKLRRKSQDYIIGRGSEIVIKNLIPYTHYNITFWDLIRNTTMSYEMDTSATDKPVEEELPKNLTMNITDTTNELEWQHPICNETYGPVFYQISIKSKNENDTRILNDIKVQYKLKDLLPLTNYTLEITTARKIENLNNTKLSIKRVFNFTTSPGIAPKVQDLELYSTDKNSASLRFSLPTNLNGIPKYVYIQWCHPLFLRKCLSKIYDLTKCSLWNNKYCNDVINLVETYNYNFTLSIKNDKTSAFGKEESLEGKAIERVPGQPLNITWKLIECDSVKNTCNLNISWIHPYNQNATITSFDVILSESNFLNVMDTKKSIRDIYKIKNKEYRSSYSHIVKYISYKTPYKISIRATNDIYKGDFASVNMTIDNNEVHVDQTPEFMKCTNETVTFKLPPLDWRLKSSKLVIIAQDYNESIKNIDDEIIKLEIFNSNNELCNEFGDTWIAVSMEITDNSTSIINIGNVSSTYIAKLNKSIVNKPLKPNTEYCFTFILVNEQEYSESLAVYHARHIFTQSHETYHHDENKSINGTNTAAYVVPILFVILLLTCGTWLTYRYLKKRKQRYGDAEHIYESMPFEDYISDSVTNRTYDRLIHS